MRKHMPRGKQTPPEKVEEVRAIAATTANLLETSRQTGVPEATVHDIVKSSDNFEEYRAQVQRKYIIATWDNIQSISSALTKYITDGKLKDHNLRDFTGALRDLRQTVENVINNINNGVVNNYNLKVDNLTEEDRKEYCKSMIKKYNWKMEDLF